MNYIPGFSNYLQTSVPRYADGGAIMDDPRQAAVMPMTQQAAPDYNSDFLNTLRASGMSEADIANLSNFSGFAPQPSTGGGLEGLNFGLALPADYKSPYGEVLITAPTSNKGNPTSYSANNQFYMYPDNFVRVVDRSTNSVVFEGTGIEAAKKAVEIGQNLTDTMGRKADYQIQTGNTQDNYSPVANEKYNKSTVSKIANVAGTVLPLAMMAIPGVNAALLGAKFAATIPGQIAFGALTGAASSGLKGNNILKGAALGGLTAAGGALIPKIPAIGDLGNLAKPIGTGIGATVGGLATGQDLKNSLLGGVASGALAYAAPSIQDAFKGIGLGPSVNASNPSFGGPNADIIVRATPSFSAPVNLGGYQTPAQKAVGKIAEPTPEEILVNARPSFTPPVNLDLSAMPTGGLNTVTTPEPTPEEILVNARDAFTPPVNLDMSTIPTGGLNAVAEPTLEEILVKARPSFTPPVNVAAPTAPTGGLDAVAEPTPEEILVKARDAFTAPVDLGGYQTPAQKYVGEIAEPTLEEILVKGRETLTPPVNLDLSAIPTGGLNTVTTPEPTLEEILVKARPSFTPPVNLNLSTVPTGGLDTLTAPELEEILVKGRETLTPPVNLSVPTTATGNTAPAEDTIKVTGRKTEPGPSITIDTPVSETPEEAEAKKKKLGVEEYLRIASLLAGVVGNVGGGGTGQTGTYGGTGTGGLNPIFTDLLPTSPTNIPGGVGTAANFAPRPMGNEDWLTYGTRPERSFFQYVPRPTGMAEGGMFAAKRGGPSKRSEFAVNGPGTGRSDDIPAVLSDGEYVFDAETVALLGDGSNRAGAKKLDDLRVKVRKHKGQKLAKGRFSANAKRPEAYLSGGRI